jgi:thioredoxin 2
MAEISEAEFEAVVEESALPVLADLWAPWCGPCKIVSPTVEAMAGEFRGRLKVVKINSDTAPALVSRFGIRGIPTLLLIHHGKEVDRVVGALDEGALRTWLARHVPADAPVK